MNSKDFVRLIEIYTKNISIESVIKRIISFEKDLNTDKKNIYKFYINLSNKDKEYLKNIIKMSVDDALFSILCVIDGVSSIEDGYNKGEFQLIYKNGNNKILLNNLQNGDFLHEYYNIE